MRPSSWGFPIIDFHCHFPLPERFTARADDAYVARHGHEKFEVLRANWRWYQEQWWDRYGFPYPDDELQPAEVLAGRWQAEIDDAQLEAAVFVTGGGNEALADALGHGDANRMIGFAHHDPFAADAAGELRRAVTERGLKGYKILAPAISGPINHPDLDPVWQVAEDLQVPVLVHFGPLDGGGGTAQHININPLMLHDVAKAHPYLDFVIPHFGCGYPRELLHLTWACRNVSVDTSGNNEWTRWMPYPLTVADLFRRFYETIGPSRIIFGSDSAAFPRGLARRYYDDQVRVVGEMGMPAVERDMIFSGNATRLVKV